METKKTPKANLESKKDFFFQTGLIISLLIVLAAFEWRFYDQDFNSLSVPIPIPIDSDTVINTPPDQPEPELPKPKTIELTAVDDDTDQDDVEFDVEMDDFTKIDFTQYVVQIDDDQPEIPDVTFVIVENMPEFDGGESALYDYLRENLKYPKMAVEAGIQGTVYVKFIVEKDGSINHVQLLRGIGGGCDEEAMRVVRNMPRWNAGKQRGVPVRVELNLPVKFSLATQ